MEQLEHRRLLATVTLNTDTGVAGEFRTEVANSAGGDTITFDLPAGSEQINLVLGEVTIDKALTIDGANTVGSGTEVTIDAGGLSRVLYIDDQSASAANVNLRNLTISGGDTSSTTGDADGGGIHSSEDLLLTDVTVTDNFAADDGGGIRSDGGNLTLVRSSVDGNAAEDRGGGLFVRNGIISISDYSSVSSNLIDTEVAGAFGGGILIGSNTTVTIDRSVVNNNNASTTYYDPVAMADTHGRGGGIYISGFDANTPSALTITNSTLMGNTVDGMGGGINSGIGVTLQVEDSNILDNTAGTDGGGLATSDFESGSGATATILRSTISGNFAGDDGGAIEVANGASLLLEDSYVTDNDTLDDGTFVGVGGSVIRTAITIRRSTISGNTVGDDGGGLRMTGQVNTVIDDTTLSNNTAADRGGAIFASGFFVDPMTTPTAERGNLTITDSLIDNNLAADDGGGLHIGSAMDVTIDETTISNNTIGDTTNNSFGAGLRIASAAFIEETTHVLVTDSSVTGNHAEDDGGGFYVGRAFSYLTIQGSLIDGNTADGDGGGGTVRFQGHVRIENSSMSQNVAARAGGGLYGIVGGSATIIRSTLANNSAGSRGGAIDIVAAPISIHQSTISGNTSGTIGGGIHLDLGPDAPTVYAQTIVGSTITDNDAGYYGGGLYVNYSASPTITGSIISGNSDSAGIGPDLVVYTTATVRYTLIGDNRLSQLAESTGDANGNIVGGPTGGLVNAMLTVLKDNGGPTPTHGLLASSPAIDRGDVLIAPGTTTDQRGAERVTDGDVVPGERVDMGSVEFGSVVPPSADFDGNGLLECADLDLLTDKTAAGTNDASFDLNGDGVVDDADIDAWLATAGAAPENASMTGGNPFLRGDFNCNGTVDGADFLAWNGAKFTNNTKWTRGNFDGNGTTDGADFLIWNGNKFTSSMMRRPENNSGEGRTTRPFKRALSDGDGNIEDEADDFKFDARKRPAERNDQRAVVAQHGAVTRPADRVELKRTEYSFPTSHASVASDSRSFVPRPTTVEHKAFIRNEPFDDDKEDGSMETLDAVFAGLLR